MRPRTIETYSVQVDNHLNPILGKLPLQDIANKALKGLIVALYEKKLSVATITLDVNITKQILASAVNENGDPVYPRTWNSEFMDLPVLAETTQKTPIANAQAIQDALKVADPIVGALIAVLASTGMRIGEALALIVAPGSDDGVSTIWIPQESKIVVRLQRQGETFGPTKTKAGAREVDLAPAINDFLKRIYLDRANLSATGALFPHSVGYYYKRAVKAGILGGFHSLRRFRVTHVRLGGVPDPLMHFWIGHADATISDRYTKVGEEIQTRKAHAERVGIGFSLPEAS